MLYIEMSGNNVMMSNFIRFVYNLYIKLVLIDL